MQVNEIAWNNTSDLFFLTNGQGCVHILSYPDLELQHVLKAHPGTCICIEFDPTGKYFATGSADALVSLWDANELACVRVFSRLDWPVRTISFSHDGRLLASASEDLCIDIGDTETGEKVADIAVEAATFTVAWNPKQYLLAFACDDKEACDRRRDAGSLKVWGFSDQGVH